MLGKWKDQLVDKYRSRIREKAITRAKARIAIAGRSVESFTEDELETIVREEEDKLRSDILKSTGLAALLILGIT
ncbi:conserved hypothetical protein [Luminiphilus syltensis NOR5-1B]|uniref:Uncharacterized protein n=1 Tax=Luminiphilus syltensis NOR5-1B TaxID=565045 RepID=B8KWQ0_9GAMM|nr:hypothetical protein [Luminiphilus syltensis]EED35077.1 conserved hypothetical protein [Luminiphilus syltensis NOR5-1B]